jgi:D-alanyl-D-alanine carboxypeptidase
VGHTKRLASATLEPMRRLLSAMTFTVLAACGTPTQANPGSGAPGVVIPPFGRMSTTVDPGAALHVAGDTTPTDTRAPTTSSSIARTNASTSTTSAPTSTSTSTSTTSTTAPTPITLPPPEPMPTLDAVVARLGTGNLAVSVSVWREGWPIYQRAVGQRVDGAAVTSSTPFVQASVSKVLTSVTVARLAARGRIELDAAPPWSAMGLAHHPQWETVSVRELIAHESGLPIAPDAWFDARGSCATPLVELLAEPPTQRRGEWTYSNGNYCALGLLLEHVTGERYDVATRRLLLEPANVFGGHLSVDGLRSDDAPYPLGVQRLDRLGAAGQWLLSTDEVAAALSTVTRRDLRALTGPGIFRDMFGWGHTGTVDGAKSCAWVLDDLDAVVVATVSGNRPARGSWLCAEVLPAVISDLSAPRGN